MNCEPTDEVRAVPTEAEAMEVGPAKFWVIYYSGHMDYIEIDPFDTADEAMANINGRLGGERDPGPSLDDFTVIHGRMLTSGHWDP